MPENNRNEYNGSRELADKLAMLVSGNIESKNYFGLDLGTFSSLVAYKSNSNPAACVNYRNIKNIRGIPSLFLCDKEGKEYVCDDAADYASTNASGLCTSVKMKLMERGIILNGRNYLPEYILQKIIEKVLDISKKDLETDNIRFEYDNLVVGVPAQFTAAEKGSIFNAILNATANGSEKKIRLVPEPILAAIYYSFIHSKDDNVNDVQRPILVYDLGAGTFDVCVLVPNPDENRNRNEPYPYRIAYSPEGLRIAGDTFDERMMEIILDKIEKNPKKDFNLANLRNEKHADRKLLKIFAREMKEELSDKMNEVTKVFCDTDEHMMRISVTREDFEKAISADLDATVKLAISNLDKSAIETDTGIDIVLVGGSSNIPFVKEKLKEAFKDRRGTSIHLSSPERAVALGAAIYSAEPEYVDNTPIPYAYAVETEDESQRGVKFLETIIPRGAKLPYTREFLYATLEEGQRAVSFTLYEVGSDEEKQRYELYEGDKTDYSFRHVFDENRGVIRKDTYVNLTVSLSPDGLLRFVTSEQDANGGSHNEQRHIVSVSWCRQMETDGRNIINDAGYEQK